MSQKVVKLGIRREKGYLYYLDNEGDVRRVKMSENGRSPVDAELVARAGVKKTGGFLYFVDQDGDISKSEIE